MQLKQLNEFEPLADLDHHSKIVASRLVEVKHLHNKDNLFSIGDNDNEEHFLLDGEVELEAQDGIKKRIKAGEPGAKFPLALLRPRKFNAKICSKTADILILELDVLQELRKTIPAAGDGIASFAPNAMLDRLGRTASINNSDTLKNFFSGVRNVIIENRINISNFDEVSSVIYKTVNDKDCSIATVTSAVQLDAAISAKLIKAANSAFFLGLTKVDSVRVAIVRLGLNLTRELVTVMVLKEVFSSTRENLQQAMHQIWRSSLKLATFCVVIGKRSSLEVNQGQMLLAGLMSEIGTLATIEYLDQFPGIGETMSESLIGSRQLNKQIGNILLKHWDFPDSLLEVILSSDNIDRHVEAADLCDLVALAKSIVRLASYRKVGVESLDQIPGYKRLGLEDDSDHFINEVMEEADRYLQLFMGVIE
ncbi:MAG: HD-like signal output (HDOD) protein [Flavobacteriales bacterium]|jgi:HD-like signal output (HDOD) protein